MAELSIKTLEAAKKDYDLFLIDLWGVVVEGGQNYPGVIDALNKLIEEKAVIFVTNSPRPAFTISRMLKNWGIVDVTDSMIQSSGDIARDMIVRYQQEHDNKTPHIFHLGEDRNKDTLIGLDYKLSHDIKKADIMLLTLYRDEQEDLEEFNELLIAAAGQKDLKIICANPDISVPEQGLTRYCPGYFARIIEQHGKEVIYTGKPHKIIYEAAFKRTSIHKSRALMIGDTFENDIAGANNVGIDSGLVLTGNTVKFHKHAQNELEKAASLYKRAKEIDIMPSFIIKLAG